MHNLHVNPTKNQSIQCWNLFNGSICNMGNYCIQLFVWQKPPVCVHFQQFASFKVSLPGSMSLGCVLIGFWCPSFVLAVIGSLYVVIWRQARDELCLLLLLWQRCRLLSTGNYRNKTPYSTQEHSRPNLANFKCLLQVQHNVFSTSMSMMPYCIIVLWYYKKCVVRSASALTYSCRSQECRFVQCTCIRFISLHRP